MRFLVLTAPFGDGHNTAATNVARALTQITAGAAECPVYDAITRGNPLTSRVLQAGYQLAITSLPAAWRFLYHRTETLDLTRPPLECFNGILDWLEAEMSRLRPQAIISTYPLYASLIRRIDATIPVYTVITDSITVHRSWTTTPSTLHFVTDEHSRTVSESLGLPPESIRVSGFPVALEFARHRAARRAELKRLLWFAATRTRHAILSLRSLLESLPIEVSLTLVLGRHAGRLSAPINRELTRDGRRRPVEVLAWCDDVPRLLREHDFVLTKAGGATTHECFASAVPMGINYVVPGQEEGNAELAVERGCAARLGRARDTGPAIRSLIEDGTFSRLARNMAIHSIQDGAFRIARTIIDTEAALPGAQS